MTTDRYTTQCQVDCRDEMTRHPPEWKSVERITVVLGRGGRKYDPFREYGQRDHTVLIRASVSIS